MYVQPRSSILIGIALFAATAGALAFLPGQQPQPDPIDHPVVIAPKQGQRPVVEAVFVLDTTGSMGGLIQAAKDKVWSIASTLAAAEPAPEIRMGLVAYRDRGDAYVTRVTDLTPDLDALHAALFQLEAQGGGDAPESVNQALHEAVDDISWGKAPNAYRVVFLVGDAPPHMDYQDDVPYPETLAIARERGIRVNAIQVGNGTDTRGIWQQVAQLGDGAYLHLAQDGNAVAIATPYDKKLAKLSAELDDTRLYYGSAAEREARAEGLAASKAVRDAAPAPVLARRATFAASGSGKAALLGDKELVDAVTTGSVALEEIAPEALPEPLQGLSADAQRSVIAEQAGRRDAIQQQIEATARRRTEYLREKVAADAGAADSLDQKLFETVREQARSLGLRYNADAPAY
jgi:hypothetical protein